MRTCDEGFTVVELLISMTIIGVVLSGIYGLVVTSSKFYLAQNAIVAMQADARAAMDFMVRELRSAYLNPVVSTTTTSNDTISFDRVDDTGYSSGGNSATTLNDTRKSWPGNMFEPSSSSAFMVRIIAGIGTGQVRSISQNTATQLTVSAGWGVIPNDTSFYVITMNKGFTRTSTTDNVLRYRIGATGANNPLSENIPQHSFQLTPPNIITITLTARTMGKDPITKQYREYTITEDVSRRN